MNGAVRWICVGFALVLAGCSHQTLTVDSVPPGAQVYLDGSYLGRAPLQASVPTDSFANVLGKVHTLAASLEGYERATIVLTSDSEFFSNSSPYPNPIVFQLIPVAGGGDESR